MKFKRLLFVAIFLAAFQLGYSQCDWWAKSFGGSSNDYLYELASDASGNIYAVGSYSGSISLGTFNLTSKGDKDIFIVKISEIGTVVWAKSAGGQYEDNGYSISLDGDGNVYVGGSFYNSAEFEGTTINSGGGNKSYLAKYDSNGNLLWVHASYGGSVKSLDTYSNKVYYVTGHDFFGAWVEFSNSGTPLDTVNHSNSFGSESEKIRVDQSGNILIAGTFYNSTDFGDGTKTPVGGTDVFIIKYTPSKTFSWAQTGGGSNNDNISDLEIDNLGNPILVASFDGSINFNGTNINSPNGQGHVLVKYSTAGTQSWAKLSGDYNSYYSSGIGIDGSNNIYHYTYRHYNTDVFDGVALSGLGEGILAKYNTNGTILDAIKLGSSNSSISLKTIAITSNDKIILSDNFYNTLSFGSKKLNSNGSQDFSIVKIDQFSDVVFKEPEICVVEIDPSTNKNKVVWNTDGMANVDYFTIYRENKISQMEAIGTVNFGDGNSFVDNTSNPVEREYFYKLSLTDVCGTEYEAEFNEHKTIHLLLYQGPANRWTLIWTDYWGVDAQYYRIYRGTTENNLALYDSVSINSYSYTDVNAPVGDVYYKIEAVVEDLACGNNPSSNRVSNTADITGYLNPSDADLFSIYPNPASTELTIDINGESANYKIIDLVGRVVLTGNVGNSNLIDLSTLDKGIYRIILETESGISGSKNLIIK